MKTEHFSCSFCHTKFIHEARYMRHRCKQMIRDQESKSPTGIAAWTFYQQWMKSYKRLAPSSDTFLSSKYYQSFMRFVRHAHKVNMPDISSFILLMRDKDISPTIWTNDQVYGMYIEYLDRQAKPAKQATITIDTLFKIADQHDCDVEDIFNNVSPNEIIELLRQRRLSPWLLLFSIKFKEFLVKSTTAEQRIIMEQIIRPNYWAQKFKKFPNETQDMIKYIKELNL